METLLQAGLSALELPTEGAAALTRYADLLLEKNKVMNLTAITDPTMSPPSTFWTVPPC